MALLVHLDSNQNLKTAIFGHHCDAQTKMPLNRSADLNPANTPVRSSRGMN